MSNEGLPGIARLRFLCSLGAVCSLLAAGALVRFALANDEAFYWLFAVLYLVFHGAAEMLFGTLLRHAFRLRLLQATAVSYGFLQWLAVVFIGVSIVEEEWYVGAVVLLLLLFTFRFVFGVLLLLSLDRQPGYFAVFAMLLPVGSLFIPAALVCVHFTFGALLEAGTLLVLAATFWRARIAQSES